MRTRFQLKETLVTITADEKYIELAKEVIREHRGHLERYILSDPFFQVTLEPYQAPKNVPEVVKRMCDAGNAAGVGPMAAVAGTLAELTVEAMMQKGAKHVIVDNGGDIALVNEIPVNVGIYTGESPIKDLALQIEPRDSMIGICTSSGRVGHSISFGNSDAVTVVSSSAALADATATALGNKITSKKDLDTSFEGIKNIDGALIIYGDSMAKWGKLPKIVKMSVGPELITRP
ncbi:MAG: UPF0280 family protein [Methanocellales archaeon]|nr:UPF0280 family protein [Methanocellales archaeon]MDD3291488.1 UPF0280 family protein [Methanocellales archaeon]MDD5234622.1 UPF0280 family protein [Methanocellales archaeon]MDD5485025.1 UPF0280 family protein [Methanocellales archaeon]